MFNHHEMFVGYPELFSLYTDIICTINITVLPTGQSNKICPQSTIKPNKIDPNSRYTHRR